MARRATTRTLPSTDWLERGTERPPCERGDPRPRRFRTPTARGASGSRLGPVALASALAIGGGGCAALGTAEAGVMWPTSDQPGRVGAVIEGHLGAGPGDDGAGFGLGASARVRLAGALQQLALGGHAMAVVHPGPVALFARVGLQLLQFEHLDGGFAFGSGSPFVNLGVVFPETNAGRTAGPVSLSFSWGRDVRLGGPASEGYFGVQAGFGTAGVVSAR